MLEFIEQLMAKTAENAVNAPEDYLEDGLLCCGKCRTPKQTRFTLAGQTFEPFCLCKCESEKCRLEEENCREQERLQRIERNTADCFYDYAMRNWNFANDNREGDEHIMNTMLRYAENFSEMQSKKKGLLIYGSQGVGKSFSAACIANYLLPQGYTCLMTSFPRIINIVSGMYQGKQEYIDSLCRYDLLIIDDLSAERETDYADEIVMNIIETRCTSGLPIIVTTNLTPDELKHTDNVRKKRIYSRLFGMTFPIHYTGEDRRRRTMLNDYAEIKEILGL